MRALFSSVLAGLLLLSATEAARAQVSALAGGAGEGVMASAATGAGVARGVPTVTMTTNVSTPTNTTFTVTFDFSEDVTGFTAGDLDVDRGATVSAVRTRRGDLYDVEIEPEDDFQGNVTVTIRANTVRSTVGNDPNAADIETFEVDTKGPEFEDATVDEDELVLTYDENLDGGSEPAPRDFDVTVDGTDYSVETVSVNRDEVTLILEDSVSRGDNVRLDYTPGNDPIRDRLENEASSFSRETVRNNTLSADDLPSAPEDLTATADGRTKHPPGLESAVRRRRQPHYRLPDRGLGYPQQRLGNSGTPHERHDH